ncbi:MAG: TlpA disulfide reductase family protein [Nocardioides sp.]|uniref:TlpA disulfide reductase family protein n=1 Tax=Nocardioides sp. TaxID=35761 RepID=UPI0039E5D7E2
MRRTWWVATATTVLALAVSACSAQKIVSAPSGSDIDVATAEMVAMKARSDVEPCPTAQTRDGGLPSVTLKCLGGGRDVDLSRLEGPLVINMFQGECAPCKKEMPALEAFYRQYGDRVPVLGVDVIDTIPGVALRQAIHRGVTFPMVADPGGELQGSSLSVSGVPTTYLLTADGSVTRLQRGGMDSEAQVRRLVEQKLGITL